MTLIVDRRQTKHLDGATNRKKFIDKMKYILREKIDELVDRRHIKNITKNTKIKVKSLNPVPWGYMHGTGKSDYVITKNKKYQVGDRIPKPQSSSRGDRIPKPQSSSRGDGEEVNDELDIILTRQEFLDLYFEDLELPNQTEDIYVDTDKYRWRRAGYIRDGVPSRLNLRKTFEMALARKIAAKASGKKPLYLDDSDLRYNFYKKEPLRARRAVMFCLMDVSGSMTVEHRELAKKFFILLYMFLTKNYEYIELVFIAHTSEAWECTEDEFFNNRMSGATVVASAMELTLKIHTERYKDKPYDCYTAHASDGDVLLIEDAITSYNLLDGPLMEVMQYYAYIQIVLPQLAAYQLYHRKLDTFLNSLTPKHKKFNIGIVSDSRDLYTVFRNLFRKR